MTSVPIMTLSPSNARTLIKSLAKGTTIADGASHLHVGHREWIAAQEELLRELKEDGGSETKFVRGVYGAGKSHFLYVIEDRARRAGWLTAHVECKADGVQMDRFETLYPAICRRLRIGSDGCEDGTEPIRAVLDQWWVNLCKGAGVRRSGGTAGLDAGFRIYGQLERRLLGANVPTTFQKALTAWAMAGSVPRDDIKRAVVEWIRGSEGGVRIEERFLRQTLAARQPGATRWFDLKPLGKGNAREALRGLLWLIRDAGYRGLVLSVDEVEELAQLPQRKRRDQALQALREHVDDAGSEYGYQGLCLYLAATPEMFENPEFFPRYDALQTRIQPVGREISWRGPVIDLDRTALSGSEMIDVAVRLREIYGIAYGEKAVRGFTDTVLSELVADVCGKSLTVARPRRLVRFVLDKMERGRGMVSVQ